jgi:hypothetical protein
MGITTSVLVIIAASSAEYAHRRGSAKLKTVYRITLALCVIAVTLAGYFGGQLVYGLNHYSWK